MIHCFPFDKRTKECRKVAQSIWVRRENAKSMRRFLARAETSIAFNLRRMGLESDEVARQLDLFRFGVHREYRAIIASQEASMAEGAGRR